jgi:DNA invertase Pin-like site-specific DNA recombinase
MRTLRLPLSSANSRLLRRKTARRTRILALSHAHQGVLCRGRDGEAVSDRPELAKALEAARKGKATLLIAKLDRLARNVAFIANPMDAGVEFLACDQPFASRLTLHILAAVAEDEARRISERTKAALQAAKARGRKLGSPIAAKTVAKARAARSAYAAKANATTLSVIREVQGSDVETLAGIARVLRARGVKTPAGRSEWQPVQVSRLLAAA